MCAAFVRDAAVDNPIPVFPLPKIAFIRQNEKWRVCGFCVEVVGKEGGEEVGRNEGRRLGRRERGGREGE